jgi:hypothetical protein
MDMLRSFHLTRTRMTSDTGEEFWVRWYPAAAGALPYPDWHAFGSPVWEPDLTDEFAGPGMFHQPLLWRGSTYPSPPGLEHHGLAEWFEFGLPSALLSPPVIDDLCGRPAIDPRGGIGLDGDAIIMGVFVPTDFTLDKIDIPLSSGSLHNLDLGSGGAFRLDAGGPVMITGFLAGINGRMVILENVGSHPIFLLSENAGSASANRIICMDDFSTRLRPREASWMQYDEASLRWREVASVPVVRQKGDLLTHTLTSATRLPVSPVDGHVLTATPAAATGLSWRPVGGGGGGGGGGDLNFYRQYVPGRFGECWYIGTYGDVNNTGPVQLDSDVLLASPWISPQGGRLKKIGGWCSNGGGGAGKIRLSIYDSVGSKDCYPNHLLAVSDIFVPISPGPFTTDIDLDIDGQQLYWLVSQGVGAGSMSWLGWTTPPNTGWPLFGWLLDETFGGAPRGIIIRASGIFADPPPPTFPGGGELLDYWGSPHVGVTYAEPTP